MTDNKNSNKAAWSVDAQKQLNTTVNNSNANTTGPEGANPMRAGGASNSNINVKSRKDRRKERAKEFAPSKSISKSLKPLCDEEKKKNAASNETKQQLKTVKKSVQVLTSNGPRSKSPVRNEGVSKTTDQKKSVVQEKHENVAKETPLEGPPAKGVGSGEEKAAEKTTLRDSQDNSEPGMKKDAISTPAEQPTGQPKVEKSPAARTNSSSSEVSKKKVQNQKKSNKGSSKKAASSISSTVSEQLAEIEERAQAAEDALAEFHSEENNKKREHEEKKRQRQEDEAVRQSKRAHRKEDFEDYYHPKEKDIDNPEADAEFETYHQVEKDGSVTPVLNHRNHLYRTSDGLSLPSTQSASVLLAIFASKYVPSVIAKIGSQSLINIMNYIKLPSFVKFFIMKPQFVAIIVILRYLAKLYGDFYSSLIPRRFYSSLRVKTTRYTTKIINANTDLRHQRYDNVLRDGETKDIHIADVTRYYNQRHYISVPFYGMVTHDGPVIDYHEYSVPYDAVIESLNISTISRLTSNVASPVPSFLNAVKRTIEGSRFNFNKKDTAQDHDALELCLDLGLNKLAEHHGQQVFQGSLISQKLT